MLKNTIGLVILLYGPSLDSQTYFTESPSKQTTLATSFPGVPRRLFPNRWSVLLARVISTILQKMLTHLLFCFLSFLTLCWTWYLHIHTHTHTHNAFSFQPAPFILKGKIMVNMPMSYYPHFVDSLACIFHLFTVKPGNSNSKVMSSPILTAYKTMKKDLSNRLSLTAYESQFAFELTGHFCSAVAGRQFQSVVVSWMGWWSTLGALWWWKNEAPAWAHLLFCSPLGAPQGRLSSFYRRKKNSGKGTSPDGSLPHSLNYCPRIVQRTICGSVSSSLPEKRHDSVNCEYFTQT